MPPPPRPTVFVSYSHQDKTWKDRLVKQLQVLELELEIWDDCQIDAGDDWLYEIEAALARARVAVLLISADFLISGFIRRMEVPEIIRRERDRGLRVIPVIVRPCPWESTKWLSKFQCRPQGARPLSAGTEHEIESNLVSLAREIRDLLCPKPELSKPIDASTPPTPGRARRLSWWLAALPALLVVIGLIWSLWHSMMPPELDGEAMVPPELDGEAEEYYKDGLEALREFDPPLAKGRFVSALEFGDFPQVRSAYAEALLLLGQNDKAFQESKEALRHAQTLTKTDRLEIEARYAKISGNWISALTRYEELHQLFPENVSYVVWKAEAQIADHRYVKAIETVQEMQKTSNDPRLALTEAVAAGLLSRYTQQIEAASRALEQAVLLESKPLQAQALRVRASALRELGRNEDARTDLKEAALLTTGQRFQWALAQSAIGELELQSGNLAAARQPFEEALKSFEDLGAGAYIALTQLNLASVELLQGKLKTAQDGYKVAAKEYADLGNKEGMAQANGNRGIILLQLGQPEAASRLFEETIMHFQASKNRGEEARYLCNIAWAHLAALVVESAKAHFTSCCNVACDISNEQTVANALQGQGDLLLYQGDLAGAYEQHERAIEILEKLGDFTGAAVSRLSLAYIEIESRRPEKAIQLAKQARAQFHDAGAFEEVLASLVLARAYLPSNLGAARRALDPVKARASTSEVLELSVRYALTEAALQEAEGRSKAALETIQKVRTQTRTHPAFEMETRLALAELELKLDPGRGLQRLGDLKRDARNSGFWRIEAAAAALLGEASSRPPAAGLAALRTAPPPVAPSSCPCAQ